MHIYNMRVSTLQVFPVNVSTRLKAHVHRTHCRSASSERSLA